MIKFGAMKASLPTRMFQHFSCGNNVEKLLRNCPVEKALIFHFLLTIYEQAFSVKQRAFSASFNKFFLYYEYY